MKGLDDRVFGSWVLLTMGAAVFGMLFAIATSMSGLVIDGQLKNGPQVWLVGLASFAGFLMTAARVRASMRKADQESTPNK
jgi:hypothetical protein